MNRDMRGSKTILITEPDYFRSVISEFRKIGRVILGSPARQTLARLLPKCDVAVVRVETKLDGRLLSAAPKLKLVASATTGVNHIDTEYLQHRKIRLVHLHGTHTAPTAEHTLALMLSLARRVAEVQPAMKRGGWDRAKWVGSQLSGATLGIIGLGRIGGAVARMAAAIGMDVQAYDPYVPSRKFKYARRVQKLVRLLASSDVISIHATLTPETRQMLNPKTFRSIKRGAILVNTARGEIIDDRALLRALSAGRVSAAALDVFSTEPLPASSPLRAYARCHPRLILTPHLGASTRQAVRAAAREMFLAVKKFLDGY